MESFVSDDTWIKQYLKKFGTVLPKKPKNGILSKNDEIFNHLLENPSAGNEDVIGVLWKRGIKVTKGMVTRVRNKMAQPA